ncbi:MAG: GDSL-type esterase/lipase family protein [Myxococcota bacterium]|nr:GDSL-type esterase/lipase family protein [Myxococcota bacterium]
MKRSLLLAALSLAFLLLFAAGAELAVRALELGAPSLRTLPLPAELAGLLREDEDLFWSLAPGKQVWYRGTPVTTNALGLRSPEVEPKQPGELRILSLGESGTFGIGVDDDQTYSARLEAVLRERLPDRRVTVLNAGVPAWSSFQSRLYLEVRGLALEPDVVLFSHEFNDYLPASLRTGGGTEADAVRSDRQLHQSRRSALWRSLQRRSALVRFIGYGVARARLRRFEAAGEFVSPYDIGLPQIGVSARLRREGDEAADASPLPERNLPTRVLPEERAGIVAEVAALARAAGVQLVVIHPSYFRSRPHECELTRFCVESGVPMFEAHEVLHPAGRLGRGTFRDEGHPSERGHQRLAVALADFLEAEGMLAD